MKSIIKYSFIALVLGLFLTTNHTQAQNKAKEEQAVKTLINDYIKAFTDFIDKKDINRVLQYMTKNGNATVTYIDLNNHVKTQSFDYPAFKTRLIEFVKTDERKTYSDISFDRIKVTKEIGLVSLSSKVSLAKETGERINGEQIVTFICKKVNGQWKVESYNLTETTNEQYQGSCYCVIFKKGKNDFATKLNIPLGSSYKMFLNAFSFRSNDQNIIIKVEGKSYRWVNKTSVYTLEEGGKSNALLGKASSEEAAIFLILKNSLYKDKCIDIISK